jgi:putative transposase
VRTPFVLRGYDYGQPGSYFVTICTKDQDYFFGEVRGGVMGLNDLGCIAHACWAEIPDHFPRVEMDAFIVMPNHVHALIALIALMPDGGGALVVTR